MRQFKPLILLAIVVLAVMMWQRHADTPVVATAPTHNVGAKPASTALQSADGSGTFLPSQARDMVRRIARGGPFEHQQDGGVFGNYEGLLPKKPRGYYHEYTVETPGARTRGARRIITGGTPPEVWYYTNNHYRSFRRFKADR